MENYVKMVLYAYPMLKIIGKEYEIHIKNKAILSHRNQASAQSIAEYIAGEILSKVQLEWLKDLVDRALDKLDETDKTLLAMRYFCGGKKGRVLQENADENEDARQIAAWAESKYSRRQSKALQKVGGIFKVLGLTEEKFYSTYADMDVFRKIVRFVEEGKDVRSCKKERCWLERENSQENAQSSVS